MFPVERSLDYLPEQAISKVSRLLWGQMPFSSDGSRL